MFGYNMLGFGSGQTSVDTLAFYAPLTSSLTLSAGTVTPAFTRSTEATVVDHEGLIKASLSGESRFQGARRVENLFTNATDTLASTSAMTAVTVPVGTFVYSMGAGTGTATFTGTATGSSGTLAANASSRTAKTLTITGVGTIIVTASVAALVDLQLEDVTVQANQNPSEYVSVGVGTQQQNNRDILLSDWDAGGATATEDSEYIMFENTTGGTVYPALEVVNSSNVDTSVLDTTIYQDNLYILSWEGRAESSPAVWYFDYGPAGTPTNSVLVTVGDVLYSRVERLDRNVGHVRLFFALNALNEKVLIKKSSIKIQAVNHGCNVDGVKYFETANGNTVASNVVTEATGAALTTLEGLLIERARTNNCLYSADLSNAAWVASNITKSSDGVTLPDGSTGTAETLTASAGNGTLLQTITLASAANTFSVYLQRKTGTGNIDITLDNGATWTTKSLTGSGTWDRVDIQGSAAANPIVGVRIVTSGDAIQMWGAQCETGNFMLSYIPTTSATVTRNADVLTYDYQPPALLGSLTYTLNQIGYSSGNKYALYSGTTCRWHYANSATNIVTYDGTTVLTATSSLSLPQQYNYGLTWEDGAAEERVTYLDGTKGPTAALDASGYDPGVADLEIGSASAANHMNGTYKEIKFYTTARTQAQMEADTA